jgi:hypothetical protein
MSPTPDDLLSAILQAALARAEQGPFGPDGKLTPEAAAEVQAIAAQADDLGALSAGLKSGTGG